MLRFSPFASLVSVSALPPPAASLPFAASLLRLASYLLWRAALLLQAAAERRARAAALAPRGRVEVEPGGPDGAARCAVYVDGRLVGWIEGVRRL